MTGSDTRLQTGDLVGDHWQVSHLLRAAPGVEVYEVYHVTESGAAVLRLYDPRLLQQSGRWEESIRISRDLAELLGQRGARIEAVGVDDATGCPFSISEKVQEPSLFEQVCRNGPLETQRLARLLCVLAPVLDRIHAAGLSHGNLKPTNLFFPPERPEKLKLSDWQASHLLDDPWSGTPGWCAPELMGPGKAITPAADIYNLGLLAFFALTGHPAFELSEPLNRANLQEMQQFGLRAASARAATLGRTIDVRLDRWFSKALDPNSARRFPSAGELALNFGSQLGLQLQLAELPPPSTKIALTPPRDAPPPPALDPGDDSIVAVSVKPLLFAEDLSALASKAQPNEAPAPGAEAPARQPEESHPKAPAPLPGGAEASRNAGPIGAAQGGAPETAIAAAQPVPIPPASDPVPPGQEPTNAGAKNEAKSATVTLSVQTLLAAAIILLGVGLAMAALMFWVVSSSTPSAATPTIAAAEPIPATTATSSPQRTEPTPVEASPAAPPSEGRPDEGSTPQTPSPPPSTPSSPASSNPLLDSMAEVTFECSPVPCESVFCNSQRFDPGVVQLKPGQNTCKGTARGYGTTSVTLELAGGQRLTHQFEMIPRKTEPSSSGKKKPCGTFINPCK